MAEGNIHGDQDKIHKALTNVLNLTDETQAATNTASPVQMEAAAPSRNQKSDENDDSDEYDWPPPRSYLPLKTLTLHKPRQPKNKNEQEKTSEVTPSQSNIPEIREFERNDSLQVQSTSQENDVEKIKSSTFADNEDSGIVSPTTTTTTTTTATQAKKDQVPDEKGSAIKPSNPAIENSTHESTDNQAIQLSEEAKALAKAKAKKEKSKLRLIKLQEQDAERERERKARQVPKPRRHPNKPPTPPTPPEISSQEYDYVLPTPNPEATLEEVLAPDGFLETVEVPNEILLQDEPIHIPTDDEMMQSEDEHLHYTSSKMTSKTQVQKDGQAAYMQRMQTTNDSSVELKKDLSHNMMEPCNKTQEKAAEESSDPSTELLFAHMKGLEIKDHKQKSQENGSLFAVQEYYPNKEPETEISFFESEEEEESMQRDINDLPPEVLTFILELLTYNEKRNTILPYRLVSSTWRVIIDDIIEKLITTAKFEAFPVLKIYSNKIRKCDGFHIEYSPSLLPKNQNTFPFNSLLLCGDGKGRVNYFPASTLDIKNLDLPTFTMKYAGHITTLSLCNMKLPGMNSLVTLLKSMFSLKFLSVFNLYLNDAIINPNLVFPCPPTIPSLKTLEIRHQQHTGKNRFNLKKSKSEPGRLFDRRNIINMWLVSAFADQISFLILDAITPMPALRRGIKYYYRQNNKLPKVNIASTSKLAFQNLEKLQIMYEHDFIILGSEFPNIKQLLVTKRADVQGPDHHQHLFDFIGKCCNTLEKLRLDIGWFCMTQPVDIDFVKPEKSFLSPFPKLRSLEMRYTPTDDRSQDIIMSKFVTLFPALTTLHLLRYPQSDMASENEIQIFKSFGTPINFTDQIIAAENEFVALEQGMYEKTLGCIRQFSRALAELDGENEQVVDEEQEGFGFEIDEWDELVEEIGIDIFEYKTAFDDKTSKVFKSLSAMGVRRQNVVMKYVFKRIDFWKIARNVKMVSISTSENPDGNVCVIWRPTDK